MTIEEAQQRALKMKHEAEHERHQIKRETAKVASRRKEIVARLRAFLVSEIELLSHFDGEESHGFKRQLPAQREPVALPKPPKKIKAQVSTDEGNG